MNGAEMIDSTDDCALWLTTGEREGEEMADGSTMSTVCGSFMFLKVSKHIGYSLISHYKPFWKSAPL